MVLSMSVNLAAAMGMNIQDMTSLHQALIRFRIFLLILRMAPGSKLMSS